MKTALIIGASGLIGNSLTALLVENENYDHVRILLRKKISIDHHRLEQIIYDFEKPNEDVVKGDHIFCCLGTTIKKAGSKKNFIRIDHDYVIETAKIALDNDATLFSVVTAMGADHNSSIFYNRTKGMVEKNLRSLSYESLHIFRPSLLLGERKEKRFGERLAQIIMPAMDFIIPPKYKAIEGKKVAGAMHYYAQENLYGVHIFTNDVLKLFKNVS